MKRPNQFVDLPINSKLRRLQVLTVGLALLFTLLISSITGIWHERRHLLTDIRSDANLIGFNVDAALLFNDAKSATTVLAALRSKPNIIAARLYASDGKAFADYSADTQSLILPDNLAQVELSQRSYHFSLNRHVALQPIKQNGEIVGHLYLVIDLIPMWLDVLTNLGQILLGTLLAFLFSSYFGKGLSALIAAPLIRLSALARQVSREKNYSLRAERGGEDEIGELIESFNLMIEQIQERDVALEKQRDQLEDEVELRTADLRDAVKEAQAASIAKSQFLANMSHEIRTPMNGVLGMAELLLGTALSITQRQYAETIFSSADSLLAIINDILDFSKIEAGKLELEYVDFDLGDMCDQLTALFFERAHQKHLEFTYELDSEVPERVRGDPNRLRQVLTNLLANALKFTESGTVALRIDRAVEQDNSEVIQLVFRVSDTGIGISAETMAKLFKSFSQADGSTTRKYGGSGLGLVICKELSQLMGGSIDVESQPGSGTVFSVSLPMQKAISLEALPTTYDSNLSGKRVLIVDDHPGNAKMLEASLLSFGMHPFVIGTAERGFQFVEEVLIAEQHFDLAILDLKTLGIQGVERCRQLQNERRFVDMQIVIITSSNYASDLAAIRKTGYDLFFYKPHRKKVLLDMLQKLFVKPPESHTLPSYIREARVLLAEDNLINQKLAKAMLSVFGCQITTANNGREAVEYFEREEFDLILMDCMMPEMDGYTAVELIRQLEKARSKAPVPILALTANAMEGDREKCLAAGMSDYLSKPIFMEAFRAKISELLEPRESPAVNNTPIQPVLVTEKLKFDPAPLANMQKIGGGTLTTQVLRLFYQNVPQLIEKLSEGAESGDNASVRHAAHSLKSSAAILGALELSELARNIEHAARDGSLNFAALPLAIEMLKLEYAQVCQVLADMAET